MEEKENLPKTVRKKKKGWKKWLKRTALTVGSVVALYSLTIPATCISNKRYQTNTAVFSHSATGWSTITDYLIYPLITLKQNRIGNGVKWHRSPTGQEFLEKAAEPQYSNLILIGHGTPECYNGTDMEIQAYQVANRMLELKIPKKNGSIISYTSLGGKVTNKNWGEALLKNPDNYRHALEGLERTVNEFDVFRAIFKDAFSSSD